jgi:hypothetical protein
MDEARWDGAARRSWRGVPAGAANRGALASMAQGVLPPLRMEQSQARCAIWVNMAEPALRPRPSSRSTGSDGDGGAAKVDPSEEQPRHP